VTYWALNAVFLAIVAVVAILAVAMRRPPRWISVLITVGVVIIATAIFDNVMIGIGLVGYNRADISGVFIGIAPIEDFAYAVAAAVLLPSVWSLLDRRAERARSQP